MRKRYIAGLILLGFFLLYAFVRSLSNILLSGRATAICPRCGSTNINPSKKRQAPDVLFRVFGCIACRCSICSYRFYRPRPSSPAI